MWYITGPILKYLGNDLLISTAAGNFAKIMIFALPAKVIYENIAAYYAAMNILKPAVRSSIIGMTINLLIGLPLVVGWPFRNFNGLGFYACPIVSCCVEWCIMGYMAYQFKVLKT